MSFSKNLYYDTTITKKFEKVYRIKSRDFDESSNNIGAAFNEEDARLFAAAPEMYDDLYEVAYFLEQTSTWERDEFAGYARMIRNTLARIDGEQETQS